MGSSILPLHQTACTVIVRTLLDRSDPHSEENRRTGRRLVKQLESNVYASVSGDVLKMFVKRYPSCVTSDLVFLLAPPHLRVLDLSRCCNIGKSENDLQVLRQALSKFMHLQSLILDDIKRCDGHDIEALMEAIVDTAPKLTSISLEHMSMIEDEHVQILLRGLPLLTSLNLSMCAGLTDDVFYLSQNQLSELKPIKDDSILPGSHLATVDLSGCQKLTNTCIRHLLELCGSNLRNLNVSCTEMDCTLLWYLSGYSLSSTVQLALQSNRKQGEPCNGLAVKQLLHTLNTLQKRLDEIKRGTLVGGLHCESSTVGIPIQENSEEDSENRGCIVTSEIDSKKQVDGVDTSSTKARSATEDCQDAAAESICSSSMAYSGTDTTATRDKQIDTSGTAARSTIEECPDAAVENSCVSSLVFSTNDTVVTRAEFEDLDSLAASQPEAVDVNSNACSEVHRNPKEGQSELDSELIRIDSNTQVSMCSVTNNDQEIDDTRKDKNICGTEHVSLENDSKDLKQGSGTVYTSDSIKYGDTSFTKDQTNSACNMINSSRSDKLGEKIDKVHETTDGNMNVENPGSVNMICQLCDHDRLGKLGSTNGNLEKNCELGATCFLPVQPNIEVCKASAVSIFDQQESSDPNQNQSTALNSSFSEPVNKDLSSVLGNNCNIRCHNAPSVCVHVDNKRSLLATSSSPSDFFAECGEHKHANSGKDALPDAVPLPNKKCDSKSSGFSAAATSSFCMMETRNASGEVMSQLNHASASSSSHTAHVDATASCSRIEAKDSNPHGEGISSLNDADINKFNSPADMQSIIKTTENDDTQTDSCLSSEPGEGLAPTSPAAMQTLPRLFEPNMVSLDISFVDFDHTVVASCLEDYFSANHHMQKLVLSQKGLTNSMLEIISKNTKDLRYFSMYDCPEISNEGLASFLRGCPRIQHLDIQGLSHVGDQGIYPLFELGDNSRLSVIKLAETCITDITLNRIATTIGPKLQELVLLWCEDVTDAGLHKIALHCPSLKTLLLRQRIMHAETLQAFTDNCPNLENVGLSSVSCIAGDLMESVAPRLKRLQTLDASWNSDLTNQAVSAILSSCPVLSELLLCGVKQITDKPFLSIIANYSKWKRCQILIQLKVREQKLRRDTGMAQLSSDEEFEDLYVPHRSTSYAPSLCDLNLSFCDHVNDNRLQEIVAVCRGTLNIVDYYGEDIAPKLLHSL